MVHVGLFVGGCLLWFRGGWPALALGNLDRPLAVDLDWCDLHQSNVYQGKMMKMRFKRKWGPMRHLKRQLDPQAVGRALIKSADPKHQRKFMSRMEKWAVDIHEVMCL